MAISTFFGLRWSCSCGSYLWTAPKSVEGDVENGPIYQMRVWQHPRREGWILSRCFYTGWEYHWRKAGMYPSAEAAMRAGANDPRLHGLPAVA